MRGKKGTVFCHPTLKKTTFPRNCLCCNGKVLISLWAGETGEILPLIVVFKSSSLSLSMSRSLSPSSSPSSRYSSSCSWSSIWSHFHDQRLLIGTHTQERERENARWTERSEVFDFVAHWNWARGTLITKRASTTPKNQSKSKQFWYPALKYPPPPPPFSRPLKIKHFGLKCESRWMPWSVQTEVNGEVVTWIRRDILTEGDRSKFFSVLFCFHDNARTWKLLVSHVLPVRSCLA